jgi:hypothetical protein
VLGEDHTKPLCLCRDSLGLIRYLTSTDVGFVFRRAASAVYKLDPTADAKSLSLWSSHSLPCILLHAMGFTDVQIMWLLRWKSIALFMTYLRNVAVLSYRQNLAFSDAEAMPHAFSDAGHVLFHSPILGPLFNSFFLHLSSLPRLSQ